MYPFSALAAQAPAHHVVGDPQLRQPTQRVQIRPVLSVVAGPGTVPRHRARTVRRKRRKTVQRSERCVCGTKRNQRKGNPLWILLVSSA